MSTEAPPNSDTRTYLLEQIDDAAVVQLYADGFESLELREKVLVWHLYQAAIAGRDIYYDQRHRHNLGIREVLEAIVTHAMGVPADTLAEIIRYTKLFWINSGPYNNLTAQKFLLNLDRQRLIEAAEIAVLNGATIALAPGEKMAERIERFAPHVLRSRLRADGDQQDARRGPGHPGVERQQPVRRRHDGRPRGLQGAAPAQLAARQARRPAGGRGLPGGRPLRPPPAPHLWSPARRHPLCVRRTGAGAERAGAFLRDRRRRRSRGLRHRLGAESRFLGRHDERLHRGLHGRPRHQGRVGKRRLLRQPREDRQDSRPGHARPMVRGSPADRSAIPQAHRDRRLRDGDRGRDRNR